MRAKRPKAERKCGIGAAGGMIGYARCRAPPTAACAKGVGQDEIQGAMMRAKTKEPIETKGDAIVLALRARGIDDTDLRYCVHEASHALDAKMAGAWSNEGIDRAMKRIGPGRAARSEILARAVEQIVCKRLGVETKPLETWVGMSVMEAIKFRDPFLGYEEALAAAKRTMVTKEAEDRATEILALAVKVDGTKRVPVKSKRTR